MTVTEFDGSSEKGYAAVNRRKTKFALLRPQSRGASSSIATTPLPSTPAIYEAGLNGVKRPAFAANRDQSMPVAKHHAHRSDAAALHVAALLPIYGLRYRRVLRSTPRENEMVLFARTRSHPENRPGGNRPALKTSQDLLDDFTNAASLRGGRSTALE